MLPAGQRNVINTAFESARVPYITRHLRMGFLSFVSRFHFKVLFNGRSSGGGG